MPRPRLYVLRSSNGADVAVALAQAMARETRAEAIKPAAEVGPLRGLDTYVVVVLTRRDLDTGSASELLGRVSEVADDHLFLVIEGETSVPGALAHLDVMRYRKRNPAASIPGIAARIHERMRRVSQRPAAAPRPVLPDELVAALADGRCVLYAGEGVHAQAGLPTSAELLERMLGGLLATDGAERWGDLTTQLELGQAQLVSELVRTRLSDADFQYVLRSAFESFSPDEEPVALLDSLARLPFQGVLTSNWDNLLVEAFAPHKPQVLTVHDREDFASLLRSGAFFVVKTHGSFDRDEPVLFTYEDYRQATMANPVFARFFASLLETHTLLFVGASLAGIEQLMLGLGITARPQREHWAFVPDEPAVELQKERFLSRYAINLLVFEPDPDFTAVPAFARELAEVVPPPRWVNEPSVPDPVERMTLRNIGPFEELTIDFEHGNRASAREWTVLLGDNGTGKSTVLRALALALAGDPAELGVDARSLLRGGSPTGSIELKLGSSTYRTTLVDDTGRMRVTSEQITPVQSGAWLALGFPPTRGVSLSGPRGPASVPVLDPSAHDLVPLIAGRVDHRLDDLKQWLVNLEMADDAGSRRTLERFYALVRELTPGVKFERGGVNQKTWDILLTTPDGPITIDQLSQGMTALLGWAGIVIKRMCELYAEDPDPERRSVLVLVDEIDVHLHPEWQRRILGLLERHFPGMQLIATTHSPLIVGSTEAGETIRLRREDGRILAEPLQPDFAGWRVDQIVTSEAFGLESAYDEDTQRKLDDLREHRERPALTPTQQAETESLVHELEQRLRRPESTPVEREAAEFVGQWLDRRVDELDAQTRLELLQEAERYLTKLQAGD